MAHAEARQKLLHFLEQRAFNPVMRAKEDDMPANRRDRLADAKRRTEAEIDRFRNYGSAEEVVTNFKRDLHSSKARDVHRELHELGLPTVNDVREEFEKLAEELGVND